MIKVIPAHVVSLGEMVWEEASMAPRQKPIEVEQAIIDK